MPHVLAALLLLAHPVPKDTHDRTLVVRLTSTGVIVDYRLEADAARAIEDLSKDQLAEAQNERSRLPFGCPQRSGKSGLVRASRLH